MAEVNEVQDKILAQIAKLIDQGLGGYDGSARAALVLAEAWAWLERPDQSHGK